MRKLCWTVRLRGACQQSPLSGNRIRSNAIRPGTQRIATDLLTLSELQRGSALLTSELIPIGDAIESAVATMASEASLRKVTLECGPILNLAIPGSRYQLEQALVNLLANAVKFNQPEGHVHIETKQDSGQISILISDTGVGIPSSDLPRIFERFYRVDKARSRQVGGTGLGLSIVKHIVERMNGRVYATSQLGKGSVFNAITFPRFTVTVKYSFKCPPDEWNTASRYSRLPVRRCIFVPAVRLCP